MTEPTLDIHGVIDGFAVSYVTKSEGGQCVRYEPVETFPTFAEACEAYREARRLTSLLTGEVAE